MAEIKSRIAGVKVTGFLSVQKQAEVALGGAKTIGIVGPNGAGKSSLLKAICFAFACPNTILGVKTLADLRCSDTSKNVRTTECQLCKRWFAKPFFIGKSKIWS